MYNKYKSGDQSQFQFILRKLENGSYIAQVQAHYIDGGLKNQTGQAIDGYDDQGALVYVVVVIFIYGFSIILMIGSSMKRGMSDNGVSKYIKNIEKVRQIERRQEKFKTRLAMQKKRGSDRIIFGGSGKSNNVDIRTETGSLASVFTDELQKNSKAPVGRTFSVSFPLHHTNPDLLVKEKSNKRSLSCGDDILPFNNNSLILNNKITVGSDSTVLSLPKFYLPEVRIDSCGEMKDSNSGEAGGVIGNTPQIRGDTSVVSAFILPTLPANVENLSKLEKMNRPISATSLVQLQPLLEAEEDATFV